MMGEESRRIRDKMGFWKENNKEIWGCGKRKKDQTRWICGKFTKRKI
jgi:hypothetical protein